MQRYKLTSEAVTEGHPDKVCDLIADSVLDECLKQDKNSRVAIEVLISGKKVVVAGQITSNAEINIEEIVRKKLREVDYTDENTNMDYKTCNIDIIISKQSNEIASGVDLGGAGDQGIMFGYATDETKNYMPYPINIANKLGEQLDKARKLKEIPYLKSDGKVQVTVEYENELPTRIDTILISTQHLKDINMKKLKNDILEKVIKATITPKMMDTNTKILINPAGNFVIGGAVADTGLTGRKIISDTYGGIAHSRRRCIFWKRCHKGRQVSGIYVKACCKKCSSKWNGKKMRDSNSLCNWDKRANRIIYKLLWNK